VLFAALAVGVVVTDQLVKQWIVATYNDGRIHQILGDWLSIDLIHNGGGLFGFFQGTAIAFAVVTIAVIGLIAWLQLQWGWRSWLITLALGLLLGGAIGNFIDRIRFGYVVDFVDIGVGSWRFYVFNVADMAVTCFFLLLIAIWLVAPRLLTSGGGSDEARTAPNGGAASSDTQGPVAE
jgi:signal peptidase II